MAENIYNRYKEFFKKENDLIKDRISWLLTTQAILFATFEYVDDDIKLQAVILSIGLVSSFSFFLCISAAIILYFIAYSNVPQAYRNIDYPETNNKKTILILGHIGPFLTTLALVIGWVYLIK
ncbi:hypothetical protein [Halarcobacter anaerophilus]|uniref:DUF202 domain-containing protein n=1 Tax=Halarcobacter anaerophilus TaxID=877500 RepID=A0A4Q0Y050_9BACT|nr:hypothetical protein [Halarcobacter anaerophilus]QDF28660.1 putative membrane protein [Halarcobacter anaerophilus]RXJ63380.1 hypothetical protein CRV06_06810 [Halarcobacter anaerophilus]